MSTTSSAELISQVQSAIETLLSELRTSQPTAQNQNEQKAYKEFTEALDALLQQHYGAAVAQRLAAGTKKIILDQLTLGVSAGPNQATIIAGKKSEIQQAVKGAMNNLRDIKKQQLTIDEQGSASKIAKDKLKKILDAITARTKALITARERVAQLQAAALSAAQSKGPAAEFKTADSYYELEQANMDLETLLSEPITIMDVKFDTAYKAIAPKEEIKSDTVKGYITAETAVEAEIQRLKRAKAALENGQRSLDDQRKNAGQ